MVRLSREHLHVSETPSGVSLFLSVHKGTSYSQVYPTPLFSSLAGVSPGTRVVRMKY